MLQPDRHPFNGKILTIADALALLAGAPGGRILKPADYPNDPAACRLVNASAPGHQVEVDQVEMGEATWVHLAAARWEMFPQSQILLDIVARQHRPDGSFWGLIERIAMMGLTVAETLECYFAGGRLCMGLVPLEIEWKISILAPSESESPAVTLLLGGDADEPSDTCQRIFLRSVPDFLRVIEAHSEPDALFPAALAACFANGHFTAQTVLNQGEARLTIGDACRLLEAGVLLIGPRDYGQDSEAGETNRPGEVVVDAALKSLVEFWLNKHGSLAPFWQLVGRAESVGLTIEEGEYVASATDLLALIGCPSAVAVRVAVYGCTLFSPPEVHVRLAGRTEVLAVNSFLKSLRDRFGPEAFLPASLLSLLSDPGALGSDIVRSGEALEPATDFAAVA